MEISKLSLVALLAGAALVELPGYAATAEQQAQAIELLRQTIAQQQQQAAPTPAQAPAETGVAVLAPAAAQPATPAPASVTVPVTGNPQEAAVQLLRSTPPGSSPEQASKAKPAKSRPPVSAKSSKPARPAPAVQQAPAAPQEVAGPKTKQQKLSDLLERYKADQLSPTEYQAERAKILAEP